MAKLDLLGKLVPWEGRANEERLESEGPGETED